MKTIVRTLFCMLVSTCVMATDYRESISDLMKKWDAALSAGDSKALLDLVTDDYVKSVSGHPKTQGKAAFLEDIEPQFKNYHYTNVQRHFLQWVPMGDIIFVRGQWSATMISVESGESFDVWMRWMWACEPQADGSLKIAFSHSVRASPDE